MLGLKLNYIGRCEKLEFLNDAERSEVNFGIWMFLLLRIYEFVETIFFIMRKKENQASFLHIFHHIGSVLMIWIFILKKTGEKMK